jgi:hypothetical protein
MIETFLTGSVPGSDIATSAWPISWCATLRRSVRLRSLRRFSGPVTMRSTAAAKSEAQTAVASRRVAIIAASLTRLARSAPVKPGVMPAI